MFDMNRTTNHSKLPPYGMIDDLMLRKGSAPFIFLYSLFGILIFLGNSMVCLAYMKVKSLRTLTNKFVVSASISGVMVSVLFIPFFVVIDDVFITASTYSMPVSSFLASFLGFSLLFNIGALTYERYIAVFRSLQYKGLVTNSRVNKALFVVWLIPLILSTLPAMFPHVMKDTVSLFMCFKVYQGFLSFILTLIIIAFFTVYYRVWRTCLFHLAFDRRQRAVLVDTNEMKDFRRISGIFRGIHQKIFKPKTNLETVKRNVELDELIGPKLSSREILSNERTGAEEFAKDLTRRLSALSNDQPQHASLCSVTLNGVLLEDTEHETTKLNQSFLPKREKRKLSVDWVPSNKFFASNSARKFSVPEQRTFTAVGRQKRLMSDGLLPRFTSTLEPLIKEESVEDGVNNDSATEPFQWDDSVSDINGVVSSPNSAHSSRSHVSFADKDATTQISLRRSASVRRKKIRGIIKNNGTRRLNYAPKQSRTVEERGTPPTMAKFGSLPSQSFPNQSSLMTSNDGPWSNPVSPRLYGKFIKYISILKSPKPVSKCSSQGSLELETPKSPVPHLDQNYVDSDLHSPDIEELEELYSVKSMVFDYSPALESPSGIMKSVTVTLNRSVCDKPDSLTSSMSVTPYSKSPSGWRTSSLKRKKVPASVQRALYRIKVLNSNWSSRMESEECQTPDSPGISEIRSSSRVTRTLRSRNSIISQAREFINEIKRTKVIAVIVSINAMCWLPLIFMNFADATGHSYLVTPKLLFTSHIIFLLNSLLMPYIYAFCKHDFKRVFRRLLWRRFDKS